MSGCLHGHRNKYTPANSADASGTADAYSLNSNAVAMHVAFHTIGCIHAIANCICLLATIATAVSNPVCRPTTPITDCRPMSTNSKALKSKAVYPAPEAGGGTGARGRGGDRGRERSPSRAGQRGGRSRERSNSRGGRATQERHCSRTPPQGSHRWRQQQQQQYHSGGRRGSYSNRSGGGDRRYNDNGSGGRGRPTLDSSVTTAWQRGQRPQAHVLDRMEAPRSAGQAVHKATNRPAALSDEEIQELLKPRPPAPISDQHFERLMSLPLSDFKRYLDETLHRGAHLVDAACGMATLADVLSNQLNLLTNRNKAQTEIIARLSKAMIQEGPCRYPPCQPPLTCPTRGMLAACQEQCCTASRRACTVMTWRAAWGVTTPPLGSRTRSATRSC